MFDVIGEINWIAVLAGFVAFFALGAVWYTVLFPTAYNVSLGRDKNAKRSNAPILLIGPALCLLAITVASAILMYALNISSYANALQFAFIVGVGYLVANTTNIALNPNFPRPLMYALVNGPFFVLGMIIVSALNVAIR